MSIHGITRSPQSQRGGETSRRTTGFPIPGETFSTPLQNRIRPHLCCFCTAFGDINCSATETGRTDSLFRLIILLHFGNVL